MAVDRQENVDPNYPDTYLYSAKLPRPIAPGEVLDAMGIFHGGRSAVRDSEGVWTFTWNQRTSVEQEWGLVVAIRLPVGAHMLSADPPAEQTRGRANATLIWRCIQAPNERFMCEIKYRLAESIA